MAKTTKVKISKTSFKFPKRPKLKQGAIPKRKTK
jgi:hypothetical protein